MLLKHHVLVRTLVLLLFSFNFYKPICTGQCNCGSKIKIRLDGNEHVVKLHYELQVGKGTCGKRPLRQPYRKKVAKSLMKKSAEKYRLEQASTIMSPGDPEPPVLPNVSTLKVAKKEYIDSQSMDRDPIIAIAKLKMLGDTEQKLALRNIGYDPFVTFFWTNYQNLVYKKYASSEAASKARWIARLSCFFLYLGVINYLSEQSSVIQMVTEAHDTGTIQNWLTQWIRSGVPPPKETVSDSQRALLTAIVRTFTGHLTIAKYCDAFLTSSLPVCYVRIDNAHFFKTYASVLRNEHRLVKKFYMGVIGVLVLCQSVGEARKILRSVLIVALSETEGAYNNKISELPCNFHKTYLQKLITGQPIVQIILDEIEEKTKNDNNDSIKQNKYPAELSEVIVGNS